MRFDIITLFPELFAPLLTSGITRRAYESGLVDVRLWNPRDHAEGNYRRVDDRSFGGGPGMVMLAEPLFKCLMAIRAERQETAPAPLVLFSPIGQTMNHGSVEQWSASAGAVLLCGRYEGVDQRFIVWATLCSRAVKSPPWPCWMRWPDCSRVCWATRAATSLTVSILRWMACWTARITPAPRFGRARLYRLN